MHKSSLIGNLVEMPQVHFGFQIKASFSYDTQKIEGSVL